MTALLTLERARPSDVFTAPGYHALPGRVDDQPARRRADDASRPAARADAGERQRRRRRPRGGHRPARARRFVGEMNERARELGLDDTQLRHPDRARRPGQLLDRRATSPTLAARLLRKPRFARIVDLPRRRCAPARATARDRQPQRPRRRLPVRRRRQDRAHATAPATCSSAPPTGATGRGWSASCSASPARPRATPTRWRCCATALDRFQRACACSTRARPLAAADIEYRDERVAARAAPRPHGHHRARRASGSRAACEAPGRGRGPARRRARVGTRRRCSSTASRCGASRWSPRRRSRGGDAACGSPRLLGVPLTWCSSRRHRSIAAGARSRCRLRRAAGRLGRR